MTGHQGPAGRKGRRQPRGFDPVIEERIRQQNQPVRGTETVSEQTIVISKDKQGSLVGSSRPTNQQQGIIGRILENIGATSRNIEARTAIGTLGQSLQPNLTPEQQTQVDRVRGAIAISSIPIALGAAGAVVAGATGTAVSNSAIPGKLLTEQFPALGLKIGGYATNTKTVGLTAKLLRTLGAPATLLAIIGSYPFAGFIKEEALQTLSFATSTATKNKDPEGLALAIAEQEEILDPTVWQQILSKIPFVNVLTQLKNFYDAARTKLDIDKKTLENLQIELGGGIGTTERVSSFEQQTAEGFISEFAKEQAAAREVTLQQQAEDQIRWDDIAAQREIDKDQERADNDAYWQEVYERNQKRKADERAADEEYWAEIKRKNIQQELDDADKQAIKDWNAGKSALNFKWLGR